MHCRNKTNNTLDLTKNHNNSSRISNREN